MKKGKKRPEKIKAVVFDVGGVLALNSSSYFSAHKHQRTKGVHDFMAEKLKIPFDQWIDSIDTPYSLAIEGKLSEKAVLKSISQRNNVSEGKLRRLLLKAYRKNFKKNKGLYRFAFKLKKQGYQIAILSDQWRISEKAVMPKRYTKKFSPVIVSCDVGIRKPGRKIYRLLLKKLGIPSKNCVFIDNQIWNIKPAKALGFKTILFKNNEQTFRQLSKLGIKLK